MTFSIKNIVKKFKDDGFIILPNALSDRTLKLIHSDIEFLTKSYSKKLKLRLNTKNSTPEILSKIEEKSHSSFYNLCLSTGDLTSMNTLQFNSKVSKIFTEIINSYKVPLSASHSGLFFNKKKVTRLQYKWHQESSYFPFHKTGFHLWYPLFNNIKKTGGPMLIKKRSHIGKYDYKSWSVKNGLTQLETNPLDVNKFKTVECNLKVGDIVIFDHNTVHCSKEVTGIKLPRVAGIRRFVGNPDGEIIPCSINLTNKNDMKNKKLTKKVSKKLN